MKQVNKYFFTKSLLRKRLFTLMAVAVISMSPVQDGYAAGENLGVSPDSAS